MKLILDRHKDILQDLIGQTIEFGLIPNLRISSSESYPDVTFYNQDYGHFYSSYELNLRVEDDSGIRKWVTLSPGPDEPIEDWAPFWVTNPILPDFNPIIEDTRFFDEAMSQKTMKGNTIHEIKNTFLDTHGDGFGMVRCNIWGFKDPIKKISIYQYGTYAACIITHDSGKEWSIYAEYDFDFWINFSAQMAANIRAQCESQIIIK
ncbi:hypothetical protein [uncultured Dokdonia sp.]|uniref:hypothetical protein n=1 Tax=uncultured Dokdonia sp. TaxID=575653 RepID=UPI0026235B32|nr:hypothetical protein [uncultured Dokdonia sp.]